MVWTRALVVIFLLTVTLVSCGSSSSSDEDVEYQMVGEDSEEPFSEEYEDMPDELIADFCRRSYSEIMEVRPESENIALPKGAITAHPRVGNPDHVRVDKDGWVVPVPQEGESSPYIVLNFMRDDERAPMIQEVITDANARVAIEYQRIGGNGFEPLETGRRFEGVVLFNPPFRAEKMKFILGEPNELTTTHYRLKLAVYACFPDRLPGEQSSSEEEK